MNFGDAREPKRDCPFGKLLAQIKGIAVTIPTLMNCEHSPDGLCLNCVQSLLSEHEAMLARAYRSMCRESWQDGESIEEVRSAINDFMCRRHGTGWDAFFPRRVNRA